MTALRRVLLLALLFTSGVINYADRQVIAVLKPLLEQQLHWSDTDYGRLVSVFQFAGALGYLVSGWFVDRVGLKWANPLGVGAWSLAAMGHAFARTLGQFTVARIALGAAESVGTPAAVKAVAIWFEARHRPFAFGLTNAAGTFGAIITPLIVPAIALTLGWRAAFLLVGGLGLIWALAWIAVTSGWDGADGASDAAAPAAARDRVDWREVLTDRRTWAVAGAKVLSDQVWWFLLFWTPDLFHRVFRIGLQESGRYIATVYGLCLLGAVAGGWASSRLASSGLGPGRARLITLLTCAGLALPIPLVTHVPQAWAAVGLLGLILSAHQVFSANIFAFATDVAPARQVGSVIAVGAFCGNLAGMGILALAGWVLARGYGYGPMLILASVSYIGAVGWIRLLAPEGLARPRAAAP